jgi:hypothetical protein
MKNLIHSKFSNPHFCLNSIPAILYSPLYRIRNNPRCSGYVLFGLISFLVLILTAPPVKASQAIKNYNNVKQIADLPPVVVCLTDTLTLFLGENGSVGLIPAQLDGGSYDPEQGPITLSISDTVFSCLQRGYNDVTLTATDSLGQSSSCISTVLVADTIPPAVLCHNFSVLPNNNGDYYIFPEDIDFGSTDNCGIMSRSVSPDFVPGIHPFLQEMVTLTVTDSSGNSDTCKAWVLFLGDADCDGVSDLLDICPGGNDQIDNNNDGYPDCAVYPGFENLSDDWRCGNTMQKVLVCHIPPGDPGNRHTICISTNAVAAHLAHGDYLGPCDEVSCLPGENTTGTIDEQSGLSGDVLLYPNPATDMVYVDFTAHAGVPATIVLYNSYSQEVYSSNYNSLPKDPVILHFPSLPGGLYYLVIHGSDFTRLLKLQVIVK